MGISFFLYTSLLIFIGLLIVSFSRAGLIFLILLPASQMLGFLDPMAIAIKGVFDIHALIAMILTAALLFSIAHYKDLSRATLLKPMLILAAFWFFGVIYPVWRGHSSLFYSLKASKEFLMIFSYFAVFLFLRTEKEVKWGWYCLLSLGFYYVVLEIAAQVFGSSLLSHLTFAYRKEAFIFWKVYPQFWPVIVIALLHSYYESIFCQKPTYLRTALGCLGLLLTFFRSYLLATIAVVPSMLLLSRQGFGRTFARSFVLVSSVSLAVVLIVLLTGGGIEKIENLSNEFVFSGMTELATHSGGALVGREVFAKPRREMIGKSPYTGYGFIDKDSKYGLLIRKQLIGETLGFIDKGDVDVALKFGYLGGAFLYGTIIYIIIVLIRLVRKKLSPQLSVRCLTMASVLMIFLLVQPVHAPLSYSFGLLPLCIALALIEKEVFLISKNDSGASETRERSIFFEQGKADSEIQILSVGQFKKKKYTLLNHPGDQKKELL